MCTLQILININNVASFCHSVVVTMMTSIYYKPLKVICYQFHIAENPNVADITDNIVAPYPQVSILHFKHFYFFIFQLGQVCTIDTWL